MYDVRRLLPAALHASLRRRSGRHRFCVAVFCQRLILELQRLAVERGSHSVGRTRSPSLQAADRDSLPVETSGLIARSGRGPGAAPAGRIDELADRAQRDHLVVGVDAISYGCTTLHNL